MATKPLGVPGQALCWTLTPPATCRYTPLCRESNAVQKPFLADSLQRAHHGSPKCRSPVEAPSARAFAMCPTVWIPPSAITGTPNLLAYSDTLYTAVAWGRPHASTAGRERAEKGSAPTRQRVPSPPGPVGFQHTHALALGNAQIPGCSFPRPSCKRSGCPGDACWDILPALNSKKLWVTSGLEFLTECLGSAETHSSSWYTGDLWGAWEGSGADSKSPSPEHPWPIATSHRLRPCSGARPLLRIPSSCYDVLLTWKGSWLGESWYVYICLDIFIYIHLHTHTHTHTCSSGKGNGQGNLMAYGN